MPWWPQAILLGLLIGFGTWIVFVDIDWFHKGGGGSSSGSTGRSGFSLFDIFD